MSGVAYLTEQSLPVFAADAGAAGILGHSDLHVLTRQDAGRLEWPEIVDGVLRYVTAHEIVLVVVDTADVWMLKPGDDANDSVVAEAAVRELRRIAEHCAVLILRHERKGGGDIADSARGSSAFSGAVDALMVLRRTGGADNRRELETVARAVLPHVPARLVIDLEGDRYVVRGSALDVARQETRAALLEYLPATRDTAFTAEQLREAAGTAKTLTDDTLRALVDEGTASRDKGAGSASSRAYGYWRGADDDLRA